MASACLTPRAPPAGARSLAARANATAAGAPCNHTASGAPDAVDYGFT